MKRRRAKKNPSTGVVLAIGGGVALLGVAAYFLMKPAASAPGQALNKAPNQAALNQPPPNQPAQLPPAQTGRQFGDPNNATTVAFACNQCARLNSIGHTQEALFWGGKCTAGGGNIAGGYT